MAKTKEILDFSASVLPGVTLDFTETFYSACTLEEMDLQFQGGVVNTVKVFTWLEKDVDGGVGVPENFIKHKNNNYIVGDDQQIKKSLVHPCPKNSVLHVKYENTGAVAHQVNLMFTVDYMAGVGRA